MYFVYLLQSQSNPRKVYIGYTDSLTHSLNDHNSAQKGYTSHFQPWKIVYYEAYEDRILAKEREYQFRRHGNTMARLKARLGL
jgi:predicted GIY-YIG superfamily endonuclease